MSADVYVYHHLMPNIPQISQAGSAGELEALLYACLVTGFGTVTLDSLTQTGGVATATRTAGLNLADGIDGMPHIITISGSTNGFNGEYILNATPGSTSCTFNCDSGLPATASGTVTIKRAPVGMSRIATSNNKSVWQFKDTSAFGKYWMLNDGVNARCAYMKLAETAASTPDYDSMSGLTPIAGTLEPGLTLRKSDNSSGGNRGFLIVADKAGVYIFLSAFLGSATGQYEGHFAGAIIPARAGDAWPGAIIGGTYDSASNPGDYNTFFSKGTYSLNGQYQLGHYFQRPYSGTGSATTFAKFGLGGINSYLYLGQQGSYSIDPNPVDNANHFHGPLYLFEGTQDTSAGKPLRGFLPGIYDPLNCDSKNNRDIVAVASGPLAGRKMLILRGPNRNSLQTRVAIDITGPWR